MMQLEPVHAKDEALELLSCYGLLVRRGEDTSYMICVCVQ